MSTRLSLNIGERHVIGDHRLAVAQEYASSHMRGLVAELAERGLKVDYRLYGSLCRAKLSFK